MTFIRGFITYAPSSYLRLTTQNRILAEQLAESEAGQRDAEARLVEALDDLGAARESLRRMMRENNAAPR